MVTSVRSRTIACTTGRQALATLSGGMISLVLLDMMLSDVLGTDVCRQIRADERTRRLPVFMMTARAEAAAVAAGRAAGVDEYITKPFALRDLVRRVRAALSRRAGAHPALAAVAVT